MTKAEIEKKIGVLEKGIASPSTAENIKTAMKKQLEKFQDQLKEMSRAGKTDTPPSKPLMFILTPRKKGGAVDFDHREDIETASDPELITAAKDLLKRTNADRVIISHKGVNIDTVNHKGVASTWASKIKLAPGQTWVSDHGREYVILDIKDGMISSSITGSKSVFKDSIKEFKKVIAEEAMTLRKGNESASPAKKSSGKISFPKYSEEKYGPRHGHDYAQACIESVLGPKNEYSTSADWGGINVWTVKGDKTEGTFVTIEDDNRVVLMTRHYEGDETIDKFLRHVKPDNIKGMRTLMQKALEIKESPQKSFAPDQSKRQNSKQYRRHSIEELETEFSDAKKKKYVIAELQRRLALKEISHEKREEIKKFLERNGLENVKHKQKNVMLDGRNIEDIPCEELVALTKQRRQAALKSDKKSKSKPVMKKITVDITQSVKKAIEDIPAEKIKADPKGIFKGLHHLRNKAGEFAKAFQDVIGSDYDSSDVKKMLSAIEAEIERLEKEHEGQKLAKGGNAGESNGKIINWKGHKGIIEKWNYPNGRDALVFTDKKKDDDILVATINVPDEDLADGEVIIKDYSENEGILAVLVNEKIISPPIRNTAERNFPVCKLLI